MDVTDLFILDMKEMDPVCHKELTGQGQSEHFKTGEIPV